MQRHVAYDELIIDHVERNGPRGWSNLADEIGCSVKPRKLRERWVNFLDPNINHGDWTPEEEERLLSLYIKSDGNYTVISANLPGRTIKMVRAKSKQLLRNVPLDAVFDDEDNGGDGGDVNDKPCDAKPPPEDPPSSTPPPKLPKIRVNKKRATVAPDSPPRMVKKPKTSPPSPTKSIAFKYEFGGSFLAPIKQLKFGQVREVEIFGAVNEKLKVFTGDARKQKWDGWGVA